MTNWTDQPTTRELNAELDPDIDPRAHLMTDEQSDGPNDRPVTWASAPGQMDRHARLDRWSEAQAGAYVMRGHLHEGPGGNHSADELAGFTVWYRNQRVVRDLTDDRDTANYPPYHR